MTHLINHTFVQTDFGIAISPDHSGKVRYCAFFSETSTFNPILTLCGLILWFYSVLAYFVYIVFDVLLISLMYSTLVNAVVLKCAI